MILKRRMRYTEVSGWHGVTVSYRAVDRPLVTSRAGYGKTFAEALNDADSQLPDGTWRRVVVSHPGTVFSDLQSSRASRFARSTMRRGEQVVIRVEHRISVEIQQPEV